jgi:hypothetical protein
MNTTATLVEMALVAGPLLQVSRLFCTKQGNDNG